MKFEVLFAPQEVAPLDHQIIISPEQGKWNDFGFHIHCTFKVNAGQDKKPVEGSMFIGLLPYEKISHRAMKEGYPQDHELPLSKLIEQYGNKPIQASVLPPFFTLLPNLEEYRHLVRKLGVGSATTFLKTVCDLVVYKDKNDEEWIDKALSSEVFKYGFMRNSEPFYAFHNAEMVLSGADYEEFDRVSEALDLTYTLSGIPNKQHIQFRFSSQGIIPGRINILIGKNGLGKSQALKQFCRAALRTVDKEISLIGSNDPGQRPMISRLLVVATPGETNNTFPPERRKDQKLHYRRLTLTRNGRNTNSRSVGESIVQLARIVDAIGSKSRWDLFVEAIGKVMPVSKLVVRCENKEIVPLVDLLPSGGEQDRLRLWADVKSNSDPLMMLEGKPYPLSSGQLTFFKFTLLCCLHIDNGSFVLMDEPETHMHPSMISEFVGLLDFLLEKTGSHAILATHSAYFVREVAREQVHVFLQEQSGQINIAQPRLRTFGATIDSISEFVFNDHISSQLIDKVYKHAKGSSFKDLEPMLNDKLSLSALMELRRRMGEED